MVLQAPGTFNSKAVCLEGTNSGYLEKHSPWDSAQQCKSGVLDPPQPPAVLDPWERW